MEIPRPIKIPLLCLAVLLPGRAAAGAALLQVVATTGMVADLVRQTGGDRVEVHQLMGPGVDPHLYKPTAGDASRLAKADAVFYQGLNLEGRMATLLERLAGRGRKVYAVSASVPRDRLLAPQEFAGHYDPHIWFDAALWATTVPAVVAGLSEADPDGAALYRANGEALVASLLDLDAWCRDRAAELPEDRRILVTSHDAFNYFGRAYGFRVIGLQGVSTVGETSLADMTSLVDFVRERQVPAIFVETSVNPAGISRVARDAGVRIGGELFSDALGEPGEMSAGHDTGTYDGMMRHNMTTIASGLGARGRETAE
jgi:manganese/zinc/iron transport system substrate-binding protein